MRIIGAFPIWLGLCSTSLYLSRVLLQFSVISDGVWGVLEVKKYIRKVKHNLRLLSKLGTTYVYLTTPPHNPPLIPKPIPLVPTRSSICFRPIRYQPCHNRD